jgi:tRNA(Ile)-lysidine synthase
MANNWTLLHARLHQTLRQRNLLQPGESLLVAVSGGQDSLCLGKLLLDLQPKWEWQLAIAHCDHGWKLDCGIAAHVRQLAQVWGLPFYLKVASQLPEKEAAAREWRYQALLEVAQAGGFASVIVGHTKSDRAETLLYNLLRGAGTDGLSALTWKRPLTADIQLIRPLLNVSRQETWEFCQQLQLPIWEDAANQNPQYARNRIRQQLIPYLQSQFNPQVETALAQTAELLRADGEYLEDCARKLLQEAIAPDKMGLNRLCLRNVPLSLQRRILRQFLHDTLPKAPNFQQVEALRDLIDAPNRTRTSSLAGRVIAQVEDEWIILHHVSSILDFRF